MEGKTTAINGDLNIERLNMFGTHTLNDMRLDAAELKLHGMKDDTTLASLNLVDPLPNINSIDLRFNNLEAATAGKFL